MRLAFDSMTVISVRLGPEQQAFLKEHKLKPGPFAKAAIEKEIRRLQFREAMEYFRKHPVKLDRPAVDIIREDRDHGH